MPEIVQGSLEWVQARLGKVTASRVADVIAKTKTGWGASRKNYMAELIAERLTGQPGDTYTNAAMQWGLDTEPQARAAYEFFRDATVEEVGFVEHPTIPMTGASPDGLVGENGLVEIKCPNTATHIDTLLSETIPAKYVTQMQFQMACVGRKWCDYVSFDPRMPEHLRLFVKRVEHDDAKVKELEAAVLEFLAELDATLNKLAKVAEPPPILMAG
jgi:putative phage-type endonuclease